MAQSVDIPFRQREECGGFYYAVGIPQWAWDQIARLEEERLAKRWLTKSEMNVMFGDG